MMRFWRISTSPQRAYQSARQIKKLVDSQVSYDWGRWALMDLQHVVWLIWESSDIRRIIAQAGGHATLIYPGRDATQPVSPFHPLDPAHMKLTKGLKTMFDPGAVLNPGRMYDGI